MQRNAFLLRLKEGTGPAYDAAHAAVWPEMLDLLKRCGVSEYSIFRRGDLLFLYLHTEEDFESTWSKIELDPANSRWQEAMKAYFAPLETNPGERFPMLTEVFYLP